MAINDLINPGTRDSIRSAMTAQAASEGFGKDEAGQEFTEIQVVTGRFGRRVSSYIAPVFGVVESNLDSLVGLRATLPFIRESLANLGDVKTLTQADKRKASRALSLLLAFVQKQTQFHTRAAQTLKNVARQKIQGVKQGIIDDLQNSPSMIKRFVGRQLDQRVGEAASERKKQLLAARSQNADTLLPDNAVEEPVARSGGSRSKPELLGGLGSRTSVGNLGGAGRSPEGAAHVHRTLAQILITDKGILKEVAKLAQAQEDTADKTKQIEQQGERDREGNATPIDKKVSLVERVAKKTGVKDKVESVKSVFSKLTDMFSGTGGLMTTLKMLKPALGLLGQGALVAGAAFAGWEIGKMIDKWTGASNYVEKAASWFMQKTGMGGYGEATEQEKETQRLADAHKGRNYLKEAEDRKAALAKGAVAKAERQAKIDSGELFIANPGAQPLRPEEQKLESRDLPVSPTPVAVEPPPPPTPAPAARVAPTSPAKAAPKVQKAAPATQTGRMEMSEEGLHLLTQREGFPKDKDGNAVAYADSGGVWTIGYGTTRINGSPVRPGMKITREEAVAEFRKQVKSEYEPVVRNALGSTAVTQPQFDALVSTAYNHPATARRAAKKLARGEALTPEDFTRTATVKGVRDKGLEARRLGEYNQFAGGPATARASAPVVASAGATSTPSMVMASAPTPTGTRAAAPVIAGTTAARAGVGTSGIVNAPSITNVYNTPAPQQAAIVPPAIRPKNDNDSLRALQGVNAVA